ncbi:MAG TPA: hypothetical protein VE689_02615 [Candidatus Udaeobacter sp.]|nr:hypothetical protein [Candidatus Udaeobacter sp.]
MSYSVAISLLLPLFFTSVAHSRITKIVIEKREPFASGHEFPVTGAYEKLVGKAYGEVDPKSPLNKIIVNLDKAPRNAKGNVEYWADIFILKPVEMRRGNGKIFYDVPNRGSKRILMFLNDATESNDPSTLQHAGNGFLMRQGYTIVWSGWQGDLLEGENSLVMRVPVATDNGKEAVRKTRTEIVVTDEGIHSQPVSGEDRVISYEAATTDKNQASLTMREKSYGARAFRSLTPTGNLLPVKKIRRREGWRSRPASKRFVSIRDSSPDISMSSSIRRRILSSWGWVSPEFVI